MNGARPPRSRSAERWEAPGWRRALQLALAALWLLDAVLQYQTFMFSQGFPRMLAATAAGNPAGVAGPVTWAGHLIGTHPGAANAAFATLQLLLALGIAWRPTTRIALAASVAWALAVWWLGEALGGVLTGAASPATGAPGAALLYALAAVLLWPAPAGQPEQGRAAPFAAAAAVGAPVARALWLVLWGGMAWLAVGASQGPGLLPGEDPAGRMPAGDPRWLRSLGSAVSALVTRHAGPVALATACLFACIAAGVYLQVHAARVTLCLAVLAALAMWAAGQDLGGLFTKATTDPGSAPLLVLLAAAYWPVRGGARHGRAAEQGRALDPARTGSTEPRPLAGVG